MRVSLGNLVQSTNGISPLSHVLRDGHELIMPPTDTLPMHQVTHIQAGANAITNMKYISTNMGSVRLTNNTLVTLATGERVKAIDLQQGDILKQVGCGPFYGDNTYVDDSLEGIELYRTLAGLTEQALKKYQTLIESVEVVREGTLKHNYYVMIRRLLGVPFTCEETVEGIRMTTTEKQGPMFITHISNCQLSRKNITNPKGEIYSVQGIEISSDVV